MAENEGKKTPSTSWRGKLWQKPGKWFYFGLPIGGYLLFATAIRALRIRCLKVGKMRSDQPLYV